ncbi:MAG: ATP-binding cassette domain-containing protein [Thermoplasmata archaeon]|uniref:Molybdate/tungstate import ATP-binding protein WtpC n=1 Tax=Candidatus Sysuiplasma superficiale TaxID=2823368 RepID=A0A8J7YMH3_9ARCH|nr:ATP-binding cassette domain-containing protein [Candidatus Sysuiplasma superficiale]
MGGRETIRAQCIARLGEFTLNAGIEDGGLIHLTGPNGSGKTTFLLCLAGHREMDNGFIQYNGMDLTQSPPAGRKFVYIDHNSAFLHMDVERHIRWALHSSIGEDYVNAVVRDLGINFSGKVRDMSLGQRTRTAIATAILSNPNALLIDEALSGVNDRADFLGKLGEMAARQGFDVVFVTHDESDSDVADHHYSMKEGRATRIR